MNTKFYRSMTQVSVAVLLIALCALTAHGQTIRIADNNATRPTGANVYGTLQDAIDAAQAGDIVYITPSVTSYGDVEVAKQITVLGAGFNTGLIDRTSTIGNLTLTSSADGINSVSGSVFKGFTTAYIIFSKNGIGAPIFDNIIIEKVISTSGITTNHSSDYANRMINNLTVRNCRLKSLRFEFSVGSLENGLSNSRFYNNIVETAFSITDAWAPNGVVNNIISNNIILYAGNALSISSAGYANNTLLINNVFSGAGDLFGNLEGVTCNNNIFYGVTPNTASTAYTFKNNTFSYNLITSSLVMPPAGTAGGTNSGLENLTGVTPGFVNVGSTAWNAEYDYSLNTGSVAKNAGSDGTDIGATGGNYPMNQNIFFRPSPMPIITEINTAGVIPQDQPLKTSIKAKSN